MELQDRKRRLISVMNGAAAPAPPLSAADLRALGSTRQASAWHRGTRPRRWARELLDVMATLSTYSACAPRQGAAAMPEGKFRA